MGKAEKHSFTSKGGKDSHSVHNLHLNFFALIISDRMMVTLIIQLLGRFYAEFSFSVLNMAYFFPSGVEIVCVKFGGLLLSWAEESHSLKNEGQSRVTTNLNNLEN